MARRARAGAARDGRFPMCAPQPPSPRRNSTLQHVPSTAHSTKLHTGTTTVVQRHQPRTEPPPPPPFSINLLPIFSLRASGVSGVPEQRASETTHTHPYLFLYVEKVVRITRNKSLRNNKHVFPYFQGVDSGGGHPTVKPKLSSFAPYRIGSAHPPTTTPRSPCYMHARIKVRVIPREQHGNAYRWRFSTVT